VPGFGSFGLPLLSRFRTGSPGRLNVGRGFFVSTLVGGLLIPATVASAKSAFGTSRHFAAPQNLVASLIGRLGSSAFRLSTSAVSMSLTGSRFSSESAPRPFHHGSRRRGGTIYWAALPSDEWQVQATKRTHLIHRPARDIIPPLGGARVFSYCI
jgi:hypothetical protein